MYKVFVNEKKLSIGKKPDDAEKCVPYESKTTLEIAVDQLQNTSCQSVCIYGEEPEKIWETFRNLMKIIEAAGGVVENPAGEFLFIYRLSKWDLPKGKIEKGESLEAAAVREVNEETGLTSLKINKFLTTTYHIYTERNGTQVLKATHWFRMQYYGKEQPQPQVEEGISEAGWKDRDAIARKVLPNTFQNIKLILEDFLD